MPDQGRIAADDSGRFALLAAAVCGFSVPVVSGTELYTDGKAIVIPCDEDVTDGLAVQAALLALGSFPRTVLTKLVGRPALRRRYLMLESSRAAHELGHLLPPRTVRRILDDYSGPIPLTCAHSLELSFAARAIPEAPPWMGVIKTSKLLLTSGGKLVAGDVEGRSVRVDVPDADSDDGEESALLRMLQTPISSRNPLTNYLLKLLGISRSRGPGSAGGGDEMAIAGDRAGERISTDGVVAVSNPAIAPVLDVVPTGRRHPEWNCHTQQYRSDWCAVTEYTPLRDEAQDFAAPRNVQLRRELARVGVALQRHRRQDEGDVIDLAAVITRKIDRRTGFHDGSNRIYERRLRTGHDLGVLILLDATGSTGESESGTRIFDAQRLVAAQLTAEFDALAIRVATYGFQSWGRQNVHFLRVKDYDDRYGRRAEQRLGSIDPGGFTRLGAAIRHGSYLARSKSGAAANLLVVIGDGTPYDDGYEHLYAQKDCEKALLEATEMGVGCVCLSVQSAAQPADLEEVWGSVPHRNLAGPDELVGSVGLLFRQALQRAAASRRRIS